MLFLWICACWVSALSVANAAAVGDASVGNQMVLPGDIKDERVVPFSQSVDDDVYVGDLNPNSFPIHHEVFESQMSFRGNRTISGFIITGLSGVPASKLERLGGIGHEYLYVMDTVNPNSRAQFMITIYTESIRKPSGPNDFHYGVKTDNSVLLLSQTINKIDLVQNAFKVATNSWHVTYVALFDNTYGHGGRAYLVKVDEIERHLFAYFQAKDDISYQLHVYGVRNGNHHA